MVDGPFQKLKSGKYEGHKIFLDVIDLFYLLYKKRRNSGEKDAISKTFSFFLSYGNLKVGIINLYHRQSPLTLDT
jgi:hypothetical protein